MQKRAATDQVRESILEAVDRLADLYQRPEAMNRVRAYVRDVHVTNTDAIDVFAAALNEGGIAAKVIRISIHDTAVGAHSLYTVTSAGLIVQLLGITAGLAQVETIDSNQRSAIPMQDLVVVEENILCVEVFGISRSFLSTDSSLPGVRNSSARPPSMDDDPHRLRDIWPMIRRIIGSERRDILTVVAYSVLSSLLSLAVPVCSQAIVNAVALGVVSSQLYALCAVVFAAMILLGIITVLERYVVDMIQRRLFVRTSFDITYRLPLIQQEAIRQLYAPELVNRFFDVMTVQKSIGKFLLEGINAILVLAAGLLLLAIYHPFFVVYDIAFLIFLPILTLVLGRGAIPTAIKVSKKKYEAAAWMEDVARTQLAFKLTGSRDFTFERIDSIASGYVDARRKHFAIIARQIVGSMMFKAAATVGILGLGGLLVIEQQISLGQLVAAEIVIILILGALEKLLAQFDLYYDLIAALDKLSAIIDQPLEDVGGRDVPVAVNGGTLTADHLVLSIAGHNVLNDVSFHVGSRGHISIVGESGAGKSTLLRVVAGLSSEHHGMMKVNGVDVKDADLTMLRKRIGMVFPENQIIPGTIEQNITLGRPLSHDDVQWALKITGLEKDILALPDGLRTELTGAGETIAYGLRRRILFARMIVHRPDILLIDEAFDGIEDAVKLRMLDAIFDWSKWTVVNVSHDPEVVRRTERVIVLHDGQIVQEGVTTEMCQMRDTPFSRLFPDPRPFQPIGETQRD